MTLFRKGIVFFLSLAIISAASTSCGVFTSKKKNKKQNAEYLFVHGDPLSLIDGRELDKKPFIDVAKRKDFDGYVLGRASYFIQQEMVKRQPPRTQQDLESENSTAKRTPEKRTLAIYDFNDRFGGYDYKPRDNSRDGFVLNFDEQDGLLRLTAIDDEAVQTLHYSHNDKLMSFLVSANSKEYGNILLALYFYKTSDGFASFERTDSDNDYLAGRGIRIVWPEEIRPSICEKDPHKHALLQQGIKDWSDSDGRIAGQKFSINEPKTYPPFSDVNIFCIQFAPVYREENRDDAVVFGVTSWFSEHNTQHLLHSTVFIFDQAHEKYKEWRNSENTETTLIRTIRHEFGHFLGLGHEFDRDVNGHLIHPSVMGYSLISYITNWDRAVLHALYESIPAITGKRKLAAQLCKDSQLGKGFARHYAFDAEIARESCPKAIYRVIDETSLELDFSRTSLKNLASLGSLTQLASLDLSDTDVEDLQPLASLPALTRLTLSHSKVADLRPIAHNENLTHVSYEPSATLGRKIIGCDNTVTSPGVKNLCATLKAAGLAEGT